MSKVAWIGTGVMGKPMASYLARAGHEMRLYNRTKSKADKAAQEFRNFEQVEADKIEVFDNIKEAVSEADFVFSIVGYPQDVENIMLAEDGVLANVKPSAVVVDMTTSSPELAKKLYSLGHDKGIQVLDAPVSGGDKGAREGTLTIMVGGDESAYEKVLPLFQEMGKTISYMGEAGNGQHTKAANQIAVAGATAAYTEALTYAVKVGLDPVKMLQAVAGGSASSWQLVNMAPRALQRDFAPGFFVKHFIKDMRIAKAEMDKRQMNLDMLNTVLETYENFAEEGHENAGTQALIQHYLAEDELPDID